MYNWVKLFFCFSLVTIFQARAVEVAALASSSDGRVIVVGYKYKPGISICLRDKQGTVTNLLYVKKVTLKESGDVCIRPVNSIKFSPDESLLAFRDQTTSIFICRVEALEQNSPVETYCFSAGDGCHNHAFSFRSNNLITIARRNSPQEIFIQNLPIVVENKESIDGGYRITFDQVIQVPPVFELNYSPSTNSLLFLFKEGKSSSLYGILRVQFIENALPKKLLFSIYDDVYGLVDTNTSCENAFASYIEIKDKEVWTRTLSEEGRYVGLILKADLTKVWEDFFASQKGSLRDLKFCFPRDAVNSLIMCGSEGSVYDVNTSKKSAVILFSPGLFDTYETKCFHATHIYQLGLT